MTALHLALSNILNMPILCFLLGIALSFIRNFSFPKKINTLLVIAILFCIGFKGGISIAKNITFFNFLFLTMLGTLVLWGFIQPIISFFLLKKYTQIDFITAAAIAASFGSVSVMTFVTAISFLEMQNINYQETTIVILAIMEIPAIISGIMIVKILNKNNVNSAINLNHILFHSVFNKAIISIAIGFLAGAVCYGYQMSLVCQVAELSFIPFLCLFLLDMGFQVGLHRKVFNELSWQLHFFAIYMPLLGASFGLILSYLFGLDVGTGTLITVLTASASYIAVPAAIKIALPEAKESIYLPLSLGIAFPFNVAIGIPLYYYAATLLLGN